jgi:hypothetical protein
MPTSAAAPYEAPQGIAASQMPQGNAAPQSSHAALAPHAAPVPQAAHYAPPQAPAAASSTAQRSAADDGLDKPPKNMLPIYALVGVIVIGAIIAAIVFATQ